MGRLDANGQQVRLTPTLGETTVIHDRKRSIAIMTIEGVVVLPIGAEVELINPNLNATVVGVRLLAPWDGKVHVCLDVDVPEEYWDEADRDQSASCIGTGGQTTAGDGFGTDTRETGSHNGYGDASCKFAGSIFR